MRHFLALSSFVLLAACGQQDSATPSTDTASADAAPAAMGSKDNQALAEAVDCSSAVNLLKNPGFANDAGNSTAGWITTQHAGDLSFQVASGDGVATIDRIGPEPWFNFLQVVGVDGLGGHSLYFQAELKLDLNDDEWPHRMKAGGGKQVLIWGRAIPNLPNSRLMFESNFEEDTHLGTTDWFTVSSRFEVPANPTELKVGFVHQANGSFSIRNPVLFDCGKDG